jgi:hypothetical protein
VERSGPGDAHDEAHDPSWDRAVPDPHASRRGEPTGPGAAGNRRDGADETVDDYPPAPLPPHERTWRHPSEIGEATWLRTEPPVALGRGLLVTSGAIGSALGIAVLYLMLPAGGSSPTASPVATTSSALRTPVVTLADPPVSQISVESPVSLSWMDLPDVTLPSVDTPSTVLVMPAGDGGGGEVMSVAVAIDGSPYMVTTANALAAIEGAGDGVRLVGSDDETVLDAQLLAIDGDLAYLAPSSGSARIEVVSFAATAAAEHGDTVTVLADEPTEVEYVTGDGIDRLDADLIVEGTPVVDADGALVALCTVVIDADGARVDLVPVGDASWGADVPGTAPTTVPAGTDPGGTAGTDPSGPTGGADLASGSVGSTAPASPSGPNGGGSPSSPTSSTTPGGPTAGNPSAGSVGAVWIGLTFDTSPEAAPLTVAAVVAGSPASWAGIVPGERIVAIDGVGTTRIDDLIATLRPRQAGDVVRLTLAPRSAGATSASTPSPSTTSPSTTNPTTTTGPAAPAGTTTTTVTAGPGTGTTATIAATRVVSVVLGAAVPGV